MLVIKRNGKVISEAKDNPNYSPSYETEKDKPISLFVTNEKEKGGK